MKGKVIRTKTTKPRRLAPQAVPRLAAWCLLAIGAPGAAAAQRPARIDDFLGFTTCRNGVAVSTLRPDVAGAAALEVEAHEAVHRRQARAFPSCEAWLGSLTSARRLIEAELPAYCAQYRVAIAHGADSAATRREYAWRIAAQSGAMENRLDVLAMFGRECAQTSGSGSPCTSAK